MFEYQFVIIENDHCDDDNNNKMQHYFKHQTKVVDAYYYDMMHFCGECMMMMILTMLFVLRLLENDHMLKLDTKVMNFIIFFHVFMLISVPFLL